MRKIILSLFPVFGLLLPLMGEAQDTLYVSNLGQTPTGSASIGSDAWIAQRLITGTDSNGYNLDSIQLLMDASSGSPIGFNVSIYNFSGGNPQNNLGSLTGLDPSVGGVFTYTASGITLSPSTFYFVVVTAATPIAQGAFVWSATRGFTQGSDMWAIDDGYLSSTDGSSWAFHIRQNVFQLAIDATPIPEPATYALAGLGLAALSFWRRKL